MSSPSSHPVAAGETLSRIAKHYGKTLEELVEINQLKDPNKLAIGQVIQLEKPSEEDDVDTSVQVMFMDKLRHPIEGIKAMLKFDGKTQELVSATNGLLPLINTETVTSTVEVWVQNAQANWRKIGETISGESQQWLNMISPGIKFTADLLPHDQEAAKSKPFSPTNNKTATSTKNSTGKAIKDGHSVNQKTSSKNYNTIELSVDIPQDLMEYFKGYKDEPITEDDWEQARKLLDCDVNVLKAFAKVESGGRNAYWQLKKDGNVYVPAILYERHYFHRLTNGTHDKTDPDVSWKVGYLSKKHKDTSLMGMSNAQVHETLKDKKQREYTHDNRVDEDDVYSSYASAYLRLLKAYRLDKNAALKSCSWGKFQIMGENFALCDATSVASFVKTMCSGEQGQIKLLVGFIQNKPSVSIKDKSEKVIGHKKSLHQAVKDKDWHMIAYNYNGPNYAADGYHTKLEAAYEQYKKAST